MHNENNSEINMENLEKSDHLVQNANQECEKIFKTKISQEKKESHNNIEKEILILNECEKRTEVKNKQVYSEKDKKENIKNLDSESHFSSNLEIDSSNKENVHEANEMKKCKSDLTYFKKRNKKQIKEERLKIQSESQRLMREREISLPYHKPKQRTLKEFLSRKKNWANIPLNMPSSKMIDVWRDIEESTQNAFEFFKSDTDSDSDTSHTPEEEVKFLPEIQQGEEISINSNNDGADYKSNNNKNDSEKDFEHINKVENSSSKSFEFIDNSVERINVFSNKKPLVSSYSINQNDFDAADNKNSGDSILKEATDKNTYVKENIIDSRSQENIDLSETLNNLKDIDNSQSLQSIKEISNDSISESSKNEDRNHRIANWLNDIPVYQKLTKQGKKETLLQKLNPKLLELTPKLSGEPDSFIDLENISNGMEAGAKKLMKRFLQNCVAPKKNQKKEMHLKITTSETNENGIITNVITEDLVYASDEMIYDPDLDKPGAKLQKLREELKKKIEQKWESEYKRVTQEMQLKIARDEKEKVQEDDEWEEREEIEETDSETSDKSEESESEEEDLYEEPNTKASKNPFILSEAEESESESENELDIIDNNDNEAKNMKNKEENKMNSEGSNESEIDDYENEIGDERDTDDYSEKEIKDCENSLEEELDSYDSSNDKDLIDLEVYSCSDVFKRCDKEAEDGKDEDYENESIECTLIPPYQPGGGLLNGGSDLTQCDEDDLLPKNILSPTIGLSLDILPEKKDADNNVSSQQTWNLDVDIELPEDYNKRKNFVPIIPETENYDLNDAYEFCSGKFPEVGEESGTQYGERDSLHEFDGAACNITGISSRSSIKSKSLKTSENQEESDEEIIKKPTLKKSRLKVLSDDSDNDDNDTEEYHEFGDAAKDFNNISKADMHLKEDYRDKSNKKFITRIKKPMKNLQFSDDEENSETEEKESASIVEEKSEESDLEEDIERDKKSDVDYDSEEMEIVNPTEFLDKEAELSGSEWSGDEDEKGLDEIDFEDGDNDKLDDNKVRSELGRIHMRHLRDEDNRNVRLLQELLFEDGDLYDDGPKREKNFKWKNIGNFFDDDKEDKEYIFEPQDEELIVEDEQSTKTRHEKELFLLQLKNERDENDDEDEQENSLLKLGRVILDKGTMVKTSDKKIQRSGAAINEVSSKTAFALTNKRGSFLSRNEDFLSKLAKYTSNVTDILGPKNSKNFVFAAKTPEKNKPCSENKSHPKRKNLSEKNVIMKNKKSKLDFGIINDAPLLLDQLL